MHTTRLLSLTFALAVPLSFAACGDDGGSSTADASLKPSPDADKNSPDAATTAPDASSVVPDAAAALPDAAVGNLDDVVDSIADELVDLNTVISTCGFGDLFPIDDAARTCMKQVVANQSQTAELANELNCALQEITAAVTCTEQQSCNVQGFESCLDTADCVDSPLFADGFGDCLEPDPV